MYFATSGILDYRMDEDLEEDLEEFRLLMAQDGIEAVRLEIERETQFGASTSEFLRLLDGNGNLLIRSDISMFSTPPENFGDLDSANTGETSFRTIEREILESDGDAEPINYREIQGFIGDGYMLHIGESLEEREELLETLVYSFVFSLVLVLPFSGLIGWLMVKNAVKGVEEVSSTAARIHKGQLDERVTILAADREIVNLSVTFNAMLDRIQNLVTEMTEMTDNIAHDLKSPLSRIRIISENILFNESTLADNSVAASDTIEECDRLLKMINDSLDVSEAEAGIGIKGDEKFDLSELVHEACELFQPVAEMKNIELSCDVQPGCQYVGSIQVFQRTVSNLLDNAIKYTDELGKVKVSISANDGVYAITVADTGIGISGTDQERVFNRFYRCDRSRSEDGCGLGLNYSRAVARTHGGEIRLSSKLGQGSVFTLLLPVEQLT
jgi:signal transduction histidine kinase